MEDTEKGGRRHAELVDDISSGRIDRGSAWLQRYSRSSDSDRLDLIRGFLGAICCQSDYGARQSSVVSELRGKRDEGHEKSGRKNRLDPTLGVRNTDTSITYLVRDSRLYLTVRQLQATGKIRCEKRIKLGMNWSPIKVSAWLIYPGQART